MTAVYVGVGEGLGVERWSHVAADSTADASIGWWKGSEKTAYEIVPTLDLPWSPGAGHEYVSECRGLPGAPQPLRRQLRRAVGSGTGTGDKQQTEVQHLGSAERQQSVYQAHLPGEALVSLSSYTLIVLHSQESRLTAPTLSHHSI